MENNGGDRFLHPEKPVRLAIIGTGMRIGALFRTLTSVQPFVFTIVGVADESEAALELARHELGKYYTGTMYTDYKKMFQEVKDIEWVMVGSKNYQHKEHAIACFAAGANVFCEKPIGISIDDCYEMREAARKSGKMFMTGFVLRYAPLYEEASKLINSGFTGKLINIEANEHLYPAHGGYIMRNWRRFKAQAGPHILEKTCHDIDVLNWLIGSVPTRVAAFGGLDIFKPENRPSDEDLKKYLTWTQAWEDIDPFTSEKDIEDNVVAILEYRNGVKVTFNVVSCSAWPQRRLRINGLNGTIELDLHTAKMEYQSMVGPDTQRHQKSAGLAQGHGGGDVIMMTEFCDIILNGKKPKISVEEGFVSAIICLCIEEARVEGRVVDLEPIWKKFEV